MIKRFILVRSADVSGISGTGVVAEGVQFSSGRVALTWRHALSSIGIYDSLADLLAIHGHSGATAVEWLDGE